MSAEQYKDLPVTVEKPIPVTFDLGNLAVFDSNVIDRNDVDSSNGKREEIIKNATRDNLQLLINQILSLPMKSTTEGGSGTGNQSSTMTLIQVPVPSSELPREKPLPKPKAPTRWEKFAIRKGIQSKEKTGKMVYDQATGKWAPKWGFQGMNKKLDSQWLVEVNDDHIGTEKELIDPRSLARTDRKKLIKKNERQQKKNLQGSR